MHAKRSTVTKLINAFLEVNKQPQMPLQTYVRIRSEHHLESVSTRAKVLYTLQQQSRLSSANLLTPSLSSTPIPRFYSKFTAVCEQTALGSHPLCEERAHDLIVNLKDSERAAIKLALEKYEAVRQKEGFEGSLAATRWRTRFGRVSKVPTLGEVDPTGSFCAFPDDWLKKKAAESAKEPSSSELTQTFFVNAVPFVAFGFLDNFTMIIAGDYIENVFGMFMCISTMAAAGLGNTISDILGIGSAFYVERACEFLGLRPPDLTPIQMEMKSCRRAANFGRIVGITVGCLIGMFPLLFMDRKTTGTDAVGEENEKSETTSNKTH